MNKIIHFLKYGLTKFRKGDILYYNHYDRYCDAKIKILHYNKDSYFYCHHKSCPHYKTHGDSIKTIKKRVIHRRFKFLKKEQELSW